MTEAVAAPAATPSWERHVEKADVVRRVRESDVFELVRSLNTDKAKAGVKRRAGATRDAVQSMFDIPSRAEVARLEKKIEQLARKVAQLDG